ncbi:glutamate receptor-like isoform X1 [Homarus americanus]|uniref:glutamate receptor-like isoform X1 n=1 Tax=Homarus americanus TaxID=6706 RepID=UPI001C469D23|nr:glutamate receptor-like isoform X1 [Homarus americanus]
MTTMANQSHHQRCLKLCVDRWWPHLFVLGKSPPYRLVGPMVELMKIMTDKLNFCSEYIVPVDRQFGTELENGTWTGMMGLLLRKEVDMSGVIFTVGEERARVIDFSVPLYMNEHVLSYKRPDLTPDIAGFVKPYTIELWNVLLVTLVVIFGSILFIHQAEPRPPRRSACVRGARREGGRPGSQNSRMWASWQWTISVLLAQSCPWLPRRDSLRLITGLWLTMAFVLGTVYRSNLKAMLILPKLRRPFDNMEELIDAGITTFIVSGSALEQAVMGSAVGSVLHKLQQQANIHINVAKAERNLVQGVEAAFLDKHTTVSFIQQTYMKEGKCLLYVASETYLGATSLSFAFPKGSPLKHKFDPIIRNLKEFGILEYMFQREVQNAQYCLKPESFSKPNNNRRSLDLEDFYGVFFVYGGGMVTAAGVFLLELALGSHKVWSAPESTK